MTPVQAAQAVFVMAIWGFNFVTSKLLLREFDPLIAMTLRFALVALVLLPFVRFPRAQIRHLLLYSVVLGGIHFPLIFSGLRGLDVSTAAIAVQLQVPFASILAAIFLGDALGWRRAVGMAIAFAGIVVIAGGPGPEISLFHLGLVVAAALAFAFSSIQLKWMGQTDPFTLNAYMALFAVPQLALLSWLLEDGQIGQIRNASWLGWACLLYMAGLATILAYSFWYPLLKHYDLNQTVPYTLLVPVFGVVSGVLVLGEPLEWRITLGGLLTVGGIAVILFRRPKTVVPRSTI